MNHRQQLAKILQATGMADCPAGQYVLVVENCLDCALTPVSTCRNCGGERVVRYWRSFDEALEAALSKVVAGLMDKEPAVHQQIEAWREYDATIEDFLAGTGRK